MWALLPIGWSLTVRFAATAAVTALAAVTLVAVAALVEGHPPRAAALWMAAPIAGLCAAGWTLGGWRAGREDVALAALGVPPAVAAAWVVALAAPLLWPSGARPLAADRTLALGPGEVTATGPDGAWRWRWTAAGVVVEPADAIDAASDRRGASPPPPAAHRSPAARAAPAALAPPAADESPAARAAPPSLAPPAAPRSPAALAPPRARSAPAAPPARWPGFALRLAAAALLAAWLVTRAVPPGPAAVVTGATIAFVGSHLLARLT